jgi:hypothetical protein
LKVSLIYLKLQRTLFLCVGSLLGFETLLIKRLIENNTEVLLALDPDAKTKALGMAQMMIECGINVSYVDIGANKDLGEMNKSSVKEAIERAVRVDKRFLFKNRLGMAIK